MTATDNEALTRGELSELAASARLLGTLLQRELDAELVGALRTAGLAPTLAGLGLHLPVEESPAELDDLAAAYFDAFVSPRHGHPPIQSLAEGGAYDGEPARAVGDLARQLGLERLGERAFGAPPDHLGSELELWAEIVERAPAHAAEFARAHLAWGLPLLHSREARAGFYGRLCAVTAAFIEAALEVRPG